MMRIDLIQAWLARQGHAPLSDAQTAGLALFQARLLAANARMNLTAITNDEDIAVKHFIDSFTLLPWLAPGARLLDLGAGAGFPGLALKIARPDLRVTLLDARRKRVFFLRETVDALGLADVDCVHARAEEAGGQDAYRGRYDLVTARAVAPLAKLAGWALPFLRAGGLLLAMKGPNAEAEAEDARARLAKHGGVLRETRPVRIADGVTRLVAVAERV